MKALIIGGTGLISTSITRQLCESGHEVTLYNRGRSENRTGFDLPVIHGDRTAYEVFEKQMQQAGEFDCVYDMVGFAPEDAASAIRAFRDRTRQFVFCSTVDVYSKPIPVYPYHESSERKSRGSYGQNKARMEDMLMEADSRGEFRATVIRPASTYGEGGNLIHTFGWSTNYLDRLRKGKPIITHGDGNSIWASCHVDDVARAFVNVMGNSSAMGKCYHVTGEEWQTWNRYHESICEAMGWPIPKIVHIPTDLLDMLAHDRVAWTEINFQYPTFFDNTAAKTDLQFEYTVPFIRGARRTAQWLIDHERIEDCEIDPFEDNLIAAWKILGEKLLVEF